MAEQSKMSAPWAALCKAVGGRATLAAIIGVSEPTIWRWSREEVKPIRIVRDAVNRICREHLIEEVFKENAQ